jgi:S1-C subfamily serine protease
MGGFSSSPDDSPTAKVTALLDQGQVEQAAKVVMDNETYFTGAMGNTDVSVAMDRLTKGLEFKYSPQIADLQARAEAVRWPVDRSRWSEVKKQMEALIKSERSLTDTAIFKYPRFRPAGYDQALKAVAARQEAIRADAPGNFATFPLGGDRNFFEDYPVELDQTAFLEVNRDVWSKALDSMTLAQSSAFLNHYGESLPSSAQDELARKYFKSLCPNPATADLKTILTAYDKCREAGLTLKTIPGIKIAFLQVTSPDLIKDKAIDFGLDIKLDMPFEADKASMRSAFQSEAVRNADILVLVSIAAAKARRVVEREETVQSTYVASYVREDNPEYEIAKAEMEAATREQQAAANKDTTHWLVDPILHYIDENEKDDLVANTGKRLKTAKEKLKATPKYIQVADYQPYPMTKAHMDIYKAGTVNYYVVDKRKKRLFRDTFDISEKSFFTVCYALKDSDPQRTKFLQESVLEEDVVRYELEPATVNLSDLLDQYASRSSEAKRYNNIGDVQRVFTADRSAIQRKRRNETYGYDKYSDKRFDSVVVVRNTGTGIGTGFYVTDDMIITNYHVVEESNYVQLKRFDDRETMGRIIARDARVDLALIQADLRGKPVCFYNKRELPLGETLEIIGHPQGLEFSITRGVISAIRKVPPINFMESTNSKVLYIQTDASSNGGNSGGPVFYGKYVVGVHDWGIKSTGSNAPAQGLNFSIHYKEVFDFLDHNGIRVCKGSK